MYCLNSLSLASFPPFVGNPNSLKIETSAWFSIVEISRVLVGNPSIGVLVDWLENLSQHLKLQAPEEAEAYPLHPAYKTYAHLSGENPMYDRISALV